MPSRRDFLLAAGAVAVSTRALSALTGAGRSDRRARVVLAEPPVWPVFDDVIRAQLPHSFFAVRAKATGSDPVVRALQRAGVGPFRGVKGLRSRVGYPVGRYDVEDDRLPVRVAVEVFRPPAPPDANSSAIRCVLVSLTATNASAGTLGVSFLISLQNAVGYTGSGEITGRRFARYGDNVNRVVTRPGATVLQLASERPAGSTSWGEMALAAFADDVTATASWESLDALEADFALDGMLDGDPRAGPSPAGETLNGALAVPTVLRPGDARTVRFALVWHFPGGSHGAPNRRADAMAAVDELWERFDRPTGRTRPPWPTA
ncbi:MAG: GH116 family glycosyl-hydrolase [Planctomycetota bacterium]|jgi:hypothetical protein